MKREKSNFKDGAASFYIVAFSTLILVIIAASFASAIIAQVTRTANEDLAQSAYDSALAGVEDAKLAFANYQKCLEAGATAVNPANDNGEVTCGNIIYWMENPDCDMVGHILGRIEKNASGEVEVNDSSESGNYNQAYTCVKIETNLTDYRSSLSQNYQSKTVRVKFGDINAANITAVRVNWYSNRDGASYNYQNYIKEKNRVAFPSLASTQVATPPTIAVQLTQTAGSFELADFEKVEGNNTDRAMVFLVPVNDTVIGNTDPSYQIVAYNGSENVVTRSQVVDTNNRDKENLPFAVYCQDDSSNEFACSTTIELPGPINGSRSNNTFVMTISLPYGQPETDFSLEFLCGDSTCNIVNPENSEDKNLANLRGMQVGIDSTGRANDLYRRVEMRLEMVDPSFAFPSYPIQLTGNNGSNAVLEKNLVVTSEWDFN